MTLTTGMAAYLNSAWVDLAPYVLGSIRGESSRLMDRPNERMGLSGNVEFDLKNTDKRFTPGDAAMLTGWELGVPLIIYVNMDGVNKPIFIGYIDKIDPDPGTYGPRRAHIACVDWFTAAMRHKIQSPTMATNKTAAEAIALVLADSQNQPWFTAIDATDTFQFPAVFDTVRKDTTLYAELSKIELSSMGYGYITRGGVFTHESVYARSGLDTPDVYSGYNAISGKSLQQSGGYRLLQTGDKVLLNQLNFTPSFSNNATNLNIEYSQDNIINRIVVTANPRYIGTTDVVLGSIGTTDDGMTIPPLQTREYTINYVDPNTPNMQICAINQIDPTTDDYAANSNEDFTGSDRTGDVTVTAVHYANKSVITMTETGGDVAFIWCRVRGTIVSIRNPVDDVQEDTDSLNEFGAHEIKINQSYQNTLDSGPRESAKILDDLKQPRRILRSATFYGRDDNLLAAFINIDVGHLIRLTDTYNNIDSYFYIQGFSYEIMGGGIVKYTLFLKEMLNLTLGLTLATIQMVADPSTNGVNYGNVPQLSNLSQYSVSAWLYYPAQVGANNTIAGTLNADDYAGWYFYVATKYLAFVEGGTTHWGTWEARSSGSIVNGQWLHVVMTRDSSTDVNTAPHLYWAGTDLPITQNEVMVGTVTDNSKHDLSIGNLYGFYNWPFIGKLKNITIYNRVLSQADVTALYNAGRDGNLMLSGMIFQGPVIPTRDSTHYNGATLTEADKLIDGVHGQVGTPIDGPTCIIP
jgi:hypothetical protein